jgi:hypothetical protein
MKKGGNSNENKIIEPNVKASKGWIVSKRWMGGRKLEMRRDNF